MNEQKIGVFCAALVWVIASLLAVRWILTGGMFNYVYVAGLAAIPIIFYWNSLQKYWIPVLFGFLVIKVSLVESPLLDAVTRPIIFFSAASLLLLLGRHVIHRGVWHANDPIFRAMFFLCAFTTARIFADPPGMARLGAGQGGLLTTMIFFLGAWSFFIAPAVINNMCEVKKAFRIILFLALLGLGHKLIANYSPETLFHRRMWVVASFVLAGALISKAKEKQRVIRYILLGLLFLAFSVLAGHRSRPFFALAMLAVGAYCTKQFKKVMPVIGAIGAIGMITIVLFRPDLLPDQARRALSVFVSLNQQGLVAYQEQGWASDFRRQMYSAAFNNIAHNPFWGRGFGFDTSEVIATLQTGATEERLDLVGGYHNGLISLAVLSGILPPIAFIIMFFQLMRRYLPWCRSLESGDLKRFAVALAIYTPPVIGQMLMNGTIEEFTYVGLLLGTQYALLKRFDQSGAGVNRSKSRYSFSPPARCAATQPE